MLIGTYYTGTIDEFNGQCIKSKFFILGVPLFPISSFYFVQKDQGMELPLVGKSARLAFGRIYGLIAGIGLTILCLNNEFPSMALRILAMVGAILFLSIGIYSQVTGKKMTEKERMQRIILEKSVGYNMLPEKLPRDTRINILQSLVKKLDNKYSAFFVNPASISSEISSSEIPLLYSLCLYMLSIKENQPASDFLQKYSTEKVFALYHKESQKI